MTLISQEKLDYAQNMMFNIKLRLEGEVVRDNYHVVSVYTDPKSSKYDPNYTELIFVHNETESSSMPDNVIVAWPQDGDLAQGMISGILWAIGRDESELTYYGQLRRSVISLEDFGLKSHLTIADLVDNWEKINEIWHKFDSTEREFLQNAAPFGGPKVTSEDELYRLSTGKMPNDLSELMAESSLLKKDGKHESLSCV